MKERIDYNDDVESFNYDNGYTHNKGERGMSNSELIITLGFDNPIDESFSKYPLTHVCEHYSHLPAASKKCSDYGNNSERDYSHSNN